jgi:Domain of unknown function (DUF4864)
MHQGPRLIFALMSWILSFTACAHQGGLAPIDRTTIRTVIERQLDAFRRDDAASAFAFASPEIQAAFSTPEDFLAVVKTFYEPVYRPRRTGGLPTLLSSMAN